VRVAEVRVLAVHVEQRDERLLVDDPAPGSVHEQGILLHLFEGGIAEQVLGFGRERSVDRDEVGALEELVELHQLDSELGSAVAAHHWVHSDDLHLETLCAVRHDPADVAEADDAKRLIGDLPALELCLLPIASTHRRHRLRDVPRQRSKKGQRVLSGRDRVPCRGVHHHDAAATRSGNVHVVDADARASDDPQSVRFLDDPRGDSRCRSNDQAVVLPDDAAELVFAHTRSEVQLDAGRLTQDSEARFRELV